MVYYYLLYIIMRAVRPNPSWRWPLVHITSVTIVPICSTYTYRCIVSVSAYVSLSLSLCLFHTISISVAVYPSLRVSLTVPRPFLDRTLGPNRFYIFFHTLLLHILIYTIVCSLHVPLLFTRLTIIATITINNNIPTGLLDTGKRHASDVCNYMTAAARKHMYRYLYLGLGILYYCV